NSGCDVRARRVTPPHATWCGAPVRAHDDVAARGGGPRRRPDVRPAAPRAQRLPDRVVGLAVRR
ncbi:hypothetical protein, partial [Streptomyces fructofermentans]|uniref:hypothetical protein n=1 Tax=Streptomyces fructofermentans TaxID=152141 RepID=UPI0037B360C9